MSMGMTSNGGLKPEINVTPLIDVLLTLLVIFLMIQPVHKTGLEARVPQQSNTTTPPAQADKTVVLELLSEETGRPRIRINEEPTTWQELQARLEAIYKMRAEKIMFVKGDDKLVFADVAEVIDVARAADPAIRIGLITRDLQQGD